MKKEAASKKEAGGDAKRVSFFTWPKLSIKITISVTRLTANRK